MNDKKFTNDPLTDFMLGVDDDRTEDMSLEEVLDRVIREKVKGDNTPLNDVDEKVAKVKKKLASFIARLDASSSGTKNLLLPLMFLFIGNGKMALHVINGAFKDESANKISKDVIINEIMPLTQKNSHYKMLIDAIETLTEDNSYGVTVPPIVGEIFVLKDELLEYLKGCKDRIDTDLKNIYARIKETDA